MPERNLGQSARNTLSDNKKRKKKSGIIFGISVVLTAITIMAAILGGAAYYIVKANLNGIAGKHREEISKIPVLKKVLPIPPDPDDPKYMTDEEVREKYVELRKENERLLDSLEELAKKNAGLTEIVNKVDILIKENENRANELNEKEKLLNDEADKLQAEKNEFYRMVAEEDTESFKAFFEGMDAETAKKLYEEILTGEREEKQIVEIARVYENMDPAAAARIIEEFGNAKIDFASSILGAMKKEASAEILAAMDPKYASQITEIIGGKQAAGTETASQEAN